MPLTMLLFKERLANVFHFSVLFVCLFVCIFWGRGGFKKMKQNHQQKWQDPSTNLVSLGAGRSRTKTTSRILACQANVPKMNSNTFYFLPLWSQSKAIPNQLMKSRFHAGETHWNIALQTTIHYCQSAHLNITSN